MGEFAQKEGMERIAKMVASSASTGPTDRMYLRSFFQSHTSQRPLHLPPLQRCVAVVV
jgi:hypothetical protein